MPSVVAPTTQEGPASPVASSLEDSSDDHGAPDQPDGPADETDGGEVSDVGAKPAPAEAAKSSEEKPAEPKDETFASPAHKSGPPSQPSGGPPSHSSRGAKSLKRHSTASYKAEQERAQLEMQRMLGTLEPGFRKPKPIFPQSVLGHLFMRKFGLNREQRSQVIRSTGGSSRFLDVERILRASDIEDNNRLDDRRSGKPPPFKRRETFAVQDADDSSSIEMPPSDSNDSDAEVLLGQDSEASSNQSADDEVGEILEIQKKAKKDFKKSFRIYKESKKKVKEIKKSRMGNAPYCPVVAMPPDSNASGSTGNQMVQQKSFKYDRKDFSKKKGDAKVSKTSSKREEAHIAESTVSTQFQYMVSSINVAHAEDEVFLASIPVGMAILDTGCTTSVVGSETVRRYTDHFRACGYPAPVPIELPPVELKGFNGQTVTTTSGLRWTVKLGNLHGTITTYVIEGVAPFLLSRRVLEGMGAVLDLGSMTITSEKHNMFNQSLPQASNGHLLLPLCPMPKELEVAQCETSNETNEPNKNSDLWSSNATCAKSQPEDSPAVPVESPKAVVSPKPKNHKMTPNDKRSQQFEVSGAEMSKDGQFTVHPWRIRPCGEERRPVSAMSVGIFAFRCPVSEPVMPAEQAIQGPACFCCNEDTPSIAQNNYGIGMETLYEDTDWVELEDLKPLPDAIQKQLRKSIMSLRKASSRLTLSRIATDPAGVKAELQDWLKDQAPKLDQRVGLIEVFAGQAQLSKTFEDRSNTKSIKLGLNYGQDFTKLHDRRCLLLLIAFCRPSHVWFSFPCKCWGPWTNMNLNRDPKTRDEILKQRDIALKYLHNVSEAWHLQKFLGGHAHCENPWSSLAWAELNLGECWEVRIDQCSLGLRSPRSDVPIFKPTKIVTTQESLAAGLVNCRCDGKHRHEHLEGAYKGRNMTSWAEDYPRKFCRVMVKLMLPEVRSSFPKRHVEEILAGEEDELDVPQQDLAVPEHGSEGVVAAQPDEEARAKALVQKVHVNTGHSSNEQMLRLAFRCQSSPAIVKAIREFKCPVCEELKRPPSHRKAAIPHAETPNQIVGVDYVQVELKRENPSGKVVEIVRNVLTVVDLATDFCQQIVVPRGPHGMSEAFHTVWGRPYGMPKTVFMDPDHRNISTDFQRYLVRHDIQLLHAAAASHWQLGKVEVCNRILRGMAQRVWAAGSTASPEETIDMCATIRNEQLRKHGFAPVQWFLGREPRHAGSLADVDQQMNPATQSQVLADPSFAASLHLRELAAKAFLEEHAKDVWRRAIAGRNRPMRGPYVQGQLVYMFRRRGRGLLSTRHGAWLGPGRVIGTESSTNSPIPRVIWVSYNGILYRCSPEALRPLPEDEALFRKLSKNLAAGALDDEVERAEVKLKGNFVQYIDLVPSKPDEIDMELDEDLQAEPDPPEPHSEGGPRKVRRRMYRSEEYWRKRAAGEPPMGSLHEGPRPQMVSLEGLDEQLAEPPDKRP
eukprot:s2147_g4.t1